MSDRPLQLVKLVSERLLRKPHQIQLSPPPSGYPQKNILLYFPSFFLKVVRFLVSAIRPPYQSCEYKNIESERNKDAFPLLFIMHNVCWFQRWKACFVAIH